MRVVAEWMRDPVAVARRMRRLEDTGRDAQATGLFEELITAFGDELGAEIWSEALDAYDRLNDAGGESRA